MKLNYLHVAIACCKCSKSRPDTHAMLTWSCDGINGGIVRFIESTCLACTQQTQTSKHLY